MASVDLEAYFERIGWRGGTRPTFETLAGILRAQMEAIPFENLDVLLGRGVRIDLESVQKKLVGDRRGGYCFEHSTLLAAALEATGFFVTRHAARVTMLSPRTSMPRTHMFLTVAIEGRTFVLDPGFGLLAPRVPVPLDDGVKVTFGHETHAMAKDGAWWTLRAFLPDKTVDAWTTTLEQENPIDFEVANHYTATHPASAFVNRIMMRALTNDGRVSVSNRDVTIVRGGETTQLVLESRAALRSLVAERFGFDLPEIERMRVPSVADWG